jgi:hypothetical protein
MTKRAMNSHALDAAIGIGGRGNADHRIQLQERNRCRWIVKVDLTRGKLLLQSIRQCAQAMIDEGRKIFRYDTFGSEAFWGDTSASTLRPTDSAVFGETPGPMPPFFSPMIALCSWSVAINLGIGAALGRWGSEGDNDSEQCHCTERRDYENFRFALQRAAASCNDVPFCIHRIPPAILLRLQIFSALVVPRNIPSDFLHHRVCETLDPSAL